MCGKLRNLLKTVGNKEKAAISGGFQSVEMRGIEPRSDNTEPSVFYVRSLLAKLAIFLPPSMSQTTDGEHIRS